MLKALVIYNAKSSVLDEIDRQAANGELMKDVDGTLRPMTKEEVEKLKADLEESTSSYISMQYDEQQKRIMMENDRI